MKIKPLYILTAVLLIIVIFLSIGVYNIFTSKDTGLFGSKNETESTAVITLDKIVNDKELDKVTIIVHVTVDGDDEIEQVNLPDGTSANTNIINYIVQENGLYKFEAIFKSGKIETAEIEVTEIEKSSSSNPYIPEGFSEVGGNVEDGLVIEDSYGNQYVWVPVENGKLIRNIATNVDSKEIDGTASALVNSVAKYYGFYIARFEASKYEIDDKIAVASIAGKNPYTNITYLDAVEYISNSEKIFGYTDCNIAIMNSYAWDTTIKWIDNKITGYSSSTNYGNYSGTIYPTGYNETDIVNNICDLSGNVREWTTEIFNDTNMKSPKKGEANIYQRVVRGGSANLKKGPMCRIYYPENTSDNYWGFRTILYK